MSNGGYHRAGKPNWWLRGPSGFVVVPSVRGDERFDEELDLSPGRYVLGVGRGSDGVRHEFQVMEEENQEVFS